MINTRACRTADTSVKSWCTTTPSWRRGRQGLNRCVAVQLQVFPFQPEHARKTICQLVLSNSLVSNLGDCRKFLGAGVVLVGCSWVLVRVERFGSRFGLQSHGTWTMEKTATLACIRKLKLCRKGQDAVNFRAGTLTHLSGNTRDAATLQHTSCLSVYGEAHPGLTPTQARYTATGVEG